MAKTSLIPVGVVLIAASWVVPATAYETGIAAIHEWSRVGNKTCIAKHWHDGSSSGQPTRKAAELAAIRVWIDFTALDYGSDWMHYRIAESKSAKCEQNSAGWTCLVSGRACKLARVQKRTAGKP